MSSSARPTLSVPMNAAAVAESTLATAEGINSATVARKSRPACNRALIRLNSCTWCLSPPRKKEVPNMNNVVITTAPAMDALTNNVLSGAQGRERDDQFGQVAQRGVQQTAHRIARLGRYGFRGVTQQRRERHDGQDGKHEQQRVLFLPELRRREHHGHEC